jgi:2-iminobutanoate/2-iminopropanoate deaminase
MATTLHAQLLFSEGMLFSQGTKAGEFVFLAQDARRSSGDPRETGVQDQTARTVENLAIALGTVGLDLGRIASLMVYLSDYSDAAAVARVLEGSFGKSAGNYPATTLIGVAGLEGDCRIRMDAIATLSRDRTTLRLADLPLAMGSRCHCARVGDFFFLSGIDAADGNGNVGSAATIQAQATETLGRIESILRAQNLSLGDLCRTFMFMPGTDYRPGYGEARKKVYQGIFAEDEFPPNSGIYIRELGQDILLRSMAIAYRGVKTIVASPKVRKAPGSFSQAVRVGDWLLLAGQDAVGFGREVAAEGDLAGQTAVTLQHTKDILEEVGGTLDDIVKTTVYLVAGQDRSKFAAAYREFFNRHKRASQMPAGLTVEVRELAPRCLVEIDAVAYLPRRTQ